MSVSKIQKRLCVPPCVGKRPCDLMAKFCLTYSICMAAFRKCFITGRDGTTALHPPIRMPLEKPKCTLHFFE